MQVFRKKEKVKTIICLHRCLGSIFTTKGLTKQGLNLFERQSKKLAKSIVKKYKQTEKNEFYFYMLEQSIFYLLLEEANIIDKEKTEISDLFNTFIESVRELIKESKND